MTGTGEDPDRRTVAGVVLLATLAAGLIVSIGLRDVQAATLLAPYPIAGVVLQFPPIGAEPNQRTCAITRAWADRSAIAWCKADGAAWRFDPRTNTWAQVITTR